MTSSVPNLLDTNIFVHLVRDDATGQRLEHERQLLLTDTVPAYSVVTEGEIRSLAYQFNWGQEKLEAMRYYLAYFRRIPLDTPGTIEAYAVIDAYSKHQGMDMGKNDVWIAAAAHETGFELLTTDRDFDHLDPLFLKRVLVELNVDI